MSTKIVLGRRVTDRQNLTLPPSVATEKMAMLGVTGSGKTYALGVVVEGLVANAIQTVILDPVGVWYGLRLAADGKSPGLSIPVFGGIHGDVPLTAESGGMIADLIVDRNISCVIDVSQFETDAERTRFATAFAARLYYRKKSSASPIHLVIEECQEFIPEQPQRGEEKMLHEFKRIWKIGRNFGIGGTLASQRPQEVNKKVLNQSQTVFAFRLTAPHERDAIAKWMMEIPDDLSHLPTGNCYVWSPFLQIREPEQYQIGQKWTYDASSTPTASKARKALPLSRIDLSELGEAIKASVQKAKDQDPKHLQAEVARLTKENAKLLAKKPELTVQIEEKPVFSDKDRKLLMGFRETVAGILTKSNELLGVIEGRLNAKPISIIHPSQIAAAHISVKDIKPAAVVRAPRFGETRLDLTSTSGDEALRNKPLSKCAVTLLRVLAQFHPSVVKKAKLAAISGYSIKSSTLDSGLSELRTRELIVGSGDYRITVIGLENAGEFTPFPTGKDAIQMWHSKVSLCASKMLGVIQGADRITRDEISMQTGYSRNSSTFDSGLSELRTLELIQSDREHVWLNPELLQ